MTNHFRLIALIWLNMLLSVAAEDLTPQQAKDEALANWWFGKNDGYYNYLYTKSGIREARKGYPWLVEVRDGVVTNATTAAGNPREGAPTIDEIFTDIQEAIDTDADTIRVQYNDTHGWPIEVFLDYDAAGRGDEYLVSISSVEEQPSYDLVTAQAELDQARNKWNSQALGVYTFEYQKQCFGCRFTDYPWSVQVSEGQRVRVVDSKGELVEEDQWKSVDDVFDLIQNSLDGKDFSITVKYSESLGYPTRYFVNRDPRIIDEEFAIVIGSMGVFGKPSLQLALARELWEASDVTSYSYRLNKPNEDVELGFPWTIQVSDGLGVSITNVGGETVDGTSIPTMETHFETLQSAFDSNAAEVEITYSKTYGFPRDVYISHGTDEKEYMELSKFQVVAEEVSK